MHITKFETFVKVFLSLIDVAPEISDRDDCLPLDHSRLGRDHFPHGVQGVGPLTLTSVTTSTTAGCLEARAFFKADAISSGRSTRIPSSVEALL